jgi:hypothetical protein
MKPCLAAIAILSAVVLASCSTPYVLTDVPRQSTYWQPHFMSYDELNASWRGGRVAVFLADGTEHRGRFVHADSMNISWIDGETDAGVMIESPKVRRLLLTHKYVWEGAALGFVAASTTLVADGAWAPGQEGGHANSMSYAGRYYTVIGGVLGGVLGAAVGSGLSQDDEIEVVPGK